MAAKPHRGGHTTHFAHHDPHRNLTVRHHNRYYNSGGGYYGTNYGRTGGGYYGGGGGYYGNNYGSGYGGYNNHYGNGNNGYGYGNNYGYASNTISADQAALRLAMAQHSPLAIQQAEAQLRADEARLGVPLTNFPSGGPAVASGPAGAGGPAIGGGPTVAGGPAAAGGGPAVGGPAVATSAASGGDGHLNAVHHQVQHMWRTTHLDRSQLAGGKPASKTPETTTPADKG